MSQELDVDGIIQNALDLAKNILTEKPLEAEMILRQLLRAVPDYPEALMLLGVVKQRTQEFTEAIGFIERGLEFQPDNADAYNNLALCYANLDQFDKSIEYLNKAVALRPSYLFYNNLAIQYRQIGKHDVALDLLRKALDFDNVPEIWCNMGGVYGEIKELDRAEECFRNAIQLDVNCAAAHVDLAFSRHLQGDWQEGFTEYEWRFAHFQQLKYYKKAYDMNRKWTGKECLQDKRILLYGEQGLGDMIQFVRYCPLLKARGAHTIVHCADILDSIIRRCPGVDETVNVDIVNNKEVGTLNHQIPGPTFPSYDYQCSLMSLPYLLGCFEISGDEYLKPLVTLPLTDYQRTFNIGLSWAGSPAHPNDQARSCPLKHFKAIYEIPGVKLFSLQVNNSRRIYPAGKKIVDYAEGCDDMRLVDMTPMIQSFEDTATIISGLDLILSVDTALVHLAGAMGVPCWVLVPYNSDWRWGLRGEQTPWYHSLRLFRQAKPQDWPGVIRDVSESLQKLMGEIE